MKFPIKWAYFKLIFYYQFQIKKFIIWMLYSLFPKIENFFKNFYRKIPYILSTMYINFKISRDIIFLHFNTNLYMFIILYFIILMSANKLIYLQPGIFFSLWVGYQIKHLFSRNEKRSPDVLFDICNLSTIILNIFEKWHFHEKGVFWMTN